MKKNKFDISVLVVEDEVDVLEQLLLIIGRRVKQTFGAKDGHEALKIFNKESIDLILSDIDMPLMDGLELLKKIREENKEIPFLMSTGLKNLDALSTAIEYGISSFLPKPVQKETLLKKLEEIALTVEARKKREELLRLKSDFIANMSHEIRTPMNAIIGFNTLLKATELSEKQKKYVGIIDNSTDTLLAIVDDILDFSKLEAKKMDLNLVSVDFVKELESVVELFRAKADEKNITLALKVDIGFHLCLCIDIFRFRQIISNLISNAIKFTERRGTILVYTEVIEQKKDLLSLHVGVKDNGIGVAKEKQKHIFEAFTQADDSTTRKFGGTGLGLSICSSLVSLMGGVLSLKSKENKGSDFFFTLDLIICQKKDISEPHTDKNHKFNKRYSAKILVAEDNELNCEFISELLNLYKIQYNVADNGKKAVEELHKEKYDLILMDINMPIMGGIDALKAIRELGYTTPVIALTASSMHGDREKYLQEGFDEYISKPIDINELEKVFDHYLQKSEFVVPEKEKIELYEKRENKNYIDLKQLQNDFAFSKGLFERLLKIFVDNYPKYMQNLQDAIEEKNYKNIYQWAHTLKGSAANLKLELVKDLSKELEDAGSKEESIDYETKFEELLSILKLIDQEIQLVFKNSDSLCF